MKKYLVFSLICTLLLTVESSFAEKKLIQFQAPDWWENVYLHLWNSTGNNGWPGESMTHEGNHVYSYILDTNKGWTNCVFNNGDQSNSDGKNHDGDKTVDVSLTGGDCWKENGSSGGFDTKYSVTEVNENNWANLRTIRFKLINDGDGYWGNDYYIYSYDNSFGNWPGTAMTLIDGWHSYTFDKTNKNLTKVAIHNNNSGDNNRRAYIRDNAAANGGCWEGTLVGSEWIESDNEETSIRATVYPSTQVSCSDDYFQSNATGNWNTPSIWKSSSDNATWMTATAAPGGEAKVTVLPGHAVTVPDGVSATPYKLYLSRNIGAATSSQLLLEGSGSLTANKVYAKVTFGVRDKWSFVGFPFNIANVTDMAGNPLTFGTNSEDYGIAVYNSEKRATTGESGWEVLQTEPSPVATANKGYLFWADREDKTLVFEAASNNISSVLGSTASVGLTFSEGAGDNSGWNLIAHPLLSTGNITLNTGQFLYTYNSTGDTYTASDKVDEIVNGLKPFDAYFVKTLSGETSVSVNTTPPLMTQSAAISEKMTLYLENGTASYLTKIRIHPNATAGYDELYDAPHMMPMSAATPQIYTLIGSGKMAINSVPEETSIVLGIRVPQAGEYTIRWDSQLFEKTAQLHDQAAGATIDMLKNSSYTFTTDREGEINDRLSIAFIPGSVTGVNRVSDDAKQIRIVSRQEGIVVDGLKGHSVVRIYDMLGQRIHEGSTQEGTYQVPLSGKGIYVVEVKNEKASVKAKVRH
jgi:hypothetical protein